MLHTRLQTAQMKGVCGKQLAAKPVTSSRPNNGSRSRRQVQVQARRAFYEAARKPPPPDLPSLLFDQRIVYLGMPVCVGSAQWWG